MPNPLALASVFAQPGYRRTDARRAIVGLIEARSGPFTAADLVADARGRGLRLGRATIFRTLESLSALGAIERVDLPAGGHAYVGCAPVHHHHLICTGCGRTTEIDDAGLRPLVQDVASSTGFTIDTHKLELFGRCPVCRASAATAAASVASA
jgi:Fur family ferric uptake transcriptional regulator